METTLRIPACAVHDAVGQNNSLANTYKHTISVPVTWRANDGNTWDIGSGHEVCIRTLSIVTRAPSHLSFVLGILLLTIVAVLILVMVTLILLARILVLVLTMVVVAILKVLIAILILIAIILTLVVISGVYLRGIVVFTPRVQMTVSPNMSSMDRALLWHQGASLPVWLVWASSWTSYPFS